MNANSSIDLLQLITKIETIICKVKLILLN